MGKRGNRAQIPLEEVYAFFCPGLASRTSFAEPEEAGCRSERKMEKAVVQLWFRPVLQRELTVCSYPSCLAHASGFLQIIQYEMKVLNSNIQITLIKQVKCNLNSNLGKHFCFLMLAEMTGC